MAGLSFVGLDLIGLHCIGLLCLFGLGQLELDSFGGFAKIGLACRSKIVRKGSIGYCLFGLARVSFVWIFHILRSFSSCFILSWLDFSELGWSSVAWIRLA